MLCFSSDSFDLSLYASGHKYIETRDLLLGLLRGCDAEITRLLQNQGANVNKIRDQASNI